MMERLLNGNRKCISSVNGELFYKDLGYILMHEHLIVKPQIHEEKYYAYTLDCVDNAISDIKDIMEYGCKSILDMTPINYGRDINKLRELSKQTGANILCCTGFHKEIFLPEYVKTITVDGLVDVLLNEVRYGIDNTSIKPAVLKCGSSFKEITNLESKCIQAVAKTHLLTGLKISTHCDKGTMGIEQLNILVKNGVRPQDIILGHIDCSEDEKYIFDLLDLNVNIEIDHIGRTLHHDKWVIELLKKVQHRNQLTQIFLSQDMGKKDYLHSYQGKPGLSYIFDDFKKMFLTSFSEDVFSQILNKNPASFFELI